MSNPGDLRDEVAEISRRLAASGMVPGTAGNVSGRVGDRVAITPTGAVLGDLTGEMISVVGLDGRLLDGPLAPTSELDLHLRIYAEHGAGAVVHTHAPAATAVATVCDELPCIHYSMLTFGGAVPVAPYATFGTPELATNVAAALSGRTAALMANHGAVTCASTLAKAYEAMELLEWACDVYGRARLLGEPRILTQDQIDDVVTAAIARSYGTTREAQRGSE